MNDWNIQSRAHACEVCGQPFADQQPYHTRLFDEPPLLRRADICEPCAKKAGDPRPIPQQGDGSDAAPRDVINDWR